MISSSVVIAGKAFDIHDLVEALAWSWQNLGMYLMYQYDWNIHYRPSLV